MKKNGKRVTSAFFLVLLVSGCAPEARAGGFVDRLISEKVGNLSPFKTPWASLLSMSSVFPGVSTLSEGRFDQRLNPSDPGDGRTFKQRYYINSSYASGPDAPVFYYICGESNCTSRSLRGVVDSLGRRYHGYVVSLEHRYYGTSQPFPTLTADNLQYLKTELALADLASFEIYAQQSLGLKGKWIAVGGSYAGSLAAYYRSVYPQLVVGALSSSGPVQARANFEEYDRVVHDRVGDRCARAMRAAVTEAENALSDPAKLAQVKAMFDADQIEDPVDFLYVMADMGAMAVQYGMKAEFCRKLTSTDPLPGYALAGKAVFSAFGIKPIEDSFQSAKSLDPNDYLNGFGMRQWMYQSCTEFGYFQNAYHDLASSARSSLINPAFHARICQQLFDLGPLDTSKIQHELYEPLLQASTSQILMTNGSNDPWAMLSISPVLGNATNPGITTYTIDGGAHCDDLGSPRSGDSASLTQARSVFTGLLDQWLR